MRRAPVVGLALAALAFAWFVVLLVDFGVMRNVAWFTLAGAGCAAAAWAVGAAPPRPRVAAVGFAAAGLPFLYFLASRGGFSLRLSLAAEALMAAGFGLAAWAAWSAARAAPEGRLDGARLGLAVAATGALLYVPVNLTGAPPFVLPGLLGLGGLALAAATLPAAGQSAKTLS